MSRPLSEVKLLVLGAHTAALQFILRRFPAPGDYLVAERFREAIDGAKGSNQAIAAARLGTQVTLLSAVGDDPAGRAALDYMQQQGVDVSAVLVSHHYPTGLGAGFYLKDGTVMGATYAGATAELTRMYLHRQRDVFARGYDVFLASLELPAEVTLYGLELARAVGIPLVVLNPAPPDTLPRQPLPMVDILTPNEPEARLLAGLAPGGQEEINEVAVRLVHTYQVPLIIITLGSAGCYVYGQGFSEQIRCPRVQAVDTSGAGDCFNSALAASLAAGWDLRRAVQLALRAASYSVTKLDSWPAYPTFEQAHAFMVGQDDH